MVVFVTTPEAAALDGKAVGVEAAVGADALPPNGFVTADGPYQSLTPLWPAQEPFFVASDV